MSTGLTNCAFISTVDKPTKVFLLMLDYECMLISIITHVKDFSAASTGDVHFEIRCNSNRFQPHPLFTHLLSNMVRPRVTAD